MNFQHRLLQRESEEEQAGMREPAGSLAPFILLYRSEQQGKKHIVEKEEKKTEGRDDEVKRQAGRRRKRGTRRRRKTGIQRRRSKITWNEMRGRWRRKM